MAQHLGPRFPKYTWFCFGNVLLYFLALHLGSVLTQGLVSVLLMPWFLFCLLPGFWFGFEP